MSATKGFINAAATTALDTRKADEHKIATDASGNPRVGVLTENPSIVTSDASTAPMRVAVAKAGFVTQRAGGDGVAFWSNDGSIFVTITKPGSNSHYVTVYAKHNDTASGDANNTPIIDVVTGAASATPSEAALPAGAIKLATILVPSTATSSQSAGVVITNTYAMTAMRGGTVVVRNATELAAWTPRDGVLAKQLDNNALWERTAGAWVRRTNGAIETLTGDAVGRVVVTHGLGKVPTSATVTICDDTPAIGHLLKANVDDFTSTTFRVRFYRMDTMTNFASNPVKFAWHADA
jgi:hypothetical protein